MQPNTTNKKQKNTQKNRKHKHCNTIHTTRTKQNIPQHRIHNRKQHKKIKKQTITKKTKKKSKHLNTNKKQCKKNITKKYSPNTDGHQ